MNGNTQTEFNMKFAMMLTVNYTLCMAIQNMFMLISTNKTG